MRVMTLGLLVFALGLGTAALLAGPGAGASTAGSLSASVGPGFTIGMSSTSVAAGDYTITVDDQSSVHNFHLSGPGVDQATSIEGTGTTTWSVTLQPGTYHFQCDAHATTMHGSLVVTATTAATTTTEAATTEAASTTTTSATTGTSPVPLAVHVGSARATRTVVTVSVSSNEPGHAVVQLLRRGRRIANGAGAVPGRIAMKLPRPLKPGRYTVAVTVSAGGATATAATSLRVR